MIVHNIIIFFEALVFIYSAFLFGRWFLSVLRARLSFPQHQAVCVLVGYCLWGLVGLLLGLSGLFNATALRLVFMAILLLSFRTVYSHAVFVTQHSFIPPIKQFFSEYPLFKSLTVLWVTLTLLIAFMPITGFDTLDYHLPIIKDLISAERLLFSAEIVKYSFLPIFAEIIYTVPSALFNNVTDPYIFQLIQYSSAVIFFIIIYGFVRNITTHPLLPIAAVLSVLAMMDFQREILHGGYIDVLMFTTAISSMLILLEGIGRKNISKGNLILSAFILGCAISMKYLALFFVGFNGLLLIYYFLRERSTFTVTTLSLSQYFFVSALIAGFWYVKNLLAFGDPVYPMLKGAEFAHELGWWVADRTIGGMFAFPFIKWGEVFVDRAHESSSMLVIFTYFLVLYALIMFFVVTRRRFGFFEIALFSSIHLYLWLMFFNSHQERYLLGSTMLVPVLLMLMADKLFVYVREHFGERGRKLFFRVVISIAFIALLGAFVGSFHFFQYKYRYLIGLDTRPEYIINIGGL